MKTFICSLFILASVFTACNGGGSGSGDDQATPAGVANMIFDAAKTPHAGDLLRVLRQYDI